MTGYDVSARLDAGRPAVEHTQRYVWAAHRRGYQHPELTGHDAQVRDWYDGEAGLDLGVLDGDAAVLRGVLTSVEEVLRVQRARSDELAEAWTGPGGDTARQFLRRHCEGGDAVVVAVQAAAQACATLVDRLWRLVDDKVAAAIDIDDRSSAQRPVWLAAAQAVISGAGDRPAAEEIVEQQVTPYVDNDIRADWLTAMRTARAGVQACYDAGIDAVTPPEARFAIPDGFAARDPAGVPPMPAAAPFTPAGVPPPVAAAPAVAVDPPAAVPAAAPVDDPAVPAASEWAAPLGDATGLPAGTGLPWGTGNLSGLLGGIADAISGLLDAPGDGFDDPVFDDPFDDDDEADADDEADDREPDADDRPADDAAAAGEVEAAAGQAGSDVPDPVDTPAEPDAAVEQADGATPPDDAAQPEDAAPPDEPPPAEPQAAAASTPCEIAADELPQAGQ